ncbi:MAG: 50S ribosomal protein L6 [Planctomycetes bacterium]|nr:50S ribosomal protein L6 [Planctomycetota bacterium]
MSRLGKKSIQLPAGVEVKIAGSAVTVKGKLGTLEQLCPPGISVQQEQNRLLVTRSGDDKRSRALHGLTRSLIQNHVTGVSEGYRIDLEIVGVSYQAAMGPKGLKLKVGFANEIVVPIPSGVKVEVPNPTYVTVTGTDKQKVGQFAAQVRATRKPEPYKGKGVRYRGEQITRKSGKSFVGSE